MDGYRGGTERMTRKMKVFSESHEGLSRSQDSVEKNWHHASLHTWTHTYTL